MPLVRFHRDAAVGRDQRQLALERLLDGEDDAQRRALPGHERRRQERKLGWVLAAAGRSLRIRWRNREAEAYACGQQRCCDRSSKLAHVEQSSPRYRPPSIVTIGKLWLKRGKAGPRSDIGHAPSAARV